MSKFNDLIYGDTPVLLDLYANWCGPCKVLSPIIKEIKSDFNDSLVILKIDVDKNTAISDKFQVKGVPTLILFKSGKIIWRQSGLLTKKELKAILQEKIKKN
ncbi:MAG: thioredoxin [Crocinitomicaceae bacterium]|nr:thioredoxin [Crocinitomicaceae bacterium]|tara:strand:+ start:1852 stop:2157 length:306 start_codon:yes stop_codon:yes gene_type:complete